ncbi:MAG: LysE family translocator [Flavobacteriaceae bacterium]
MSHEILIAFILATSALTIAPGPDNIFVLMQSMTNGVRAGLTTVIGLVSGCLVHTTLLAFGVAEIIKQSDTVFFCIKVFGAIYLFYLAFSVYKSDASIKWNEKTNLKHKSSSSLFWKGFLMNVLNPKVAIFFLAFFPGFLFSIEMNPVIQFYVLGFLFMLVALIIFSTIAVLAGTISGYFLRYPKVAVYLKWLQIVVFIGIAVYLFLSNK